MRIRWRGLELPSRVVRDESVSTDLYGRFVIEPFEQGFGTTIGNSLRRVLLSSLEGAAVSSVKIQGVSHEFMTMDGVLEDVTDILLNIKGVVLKLDGVETRTMTVERTTPGVVTAGDFVADASVSIANADHHIATLTEDTKLNIEMEISRGRGYVPSELNKKEDAALGTIPIDSIFTPIVKVNFFVENTRVGQRTDYDKLIVEIWTNGGISPKEALLYGANIMQRHLDVFVSYGQLPEEEEEEEEITAEEQALYEKLRLPISELELSVRSSNCLKEANIKTIADLVRKPESELLNFRNFGKKSLTEINDLLKVMGLSLGMKVDLKKLKKKE